MTFFQLFYANIYSDFSFFSPFSGKAKMQIKYFLLVLMVAYSQKIATSHILTSTYLDMSLPACKRLLTFAVMNDLCPTYGDYSSGK